MEEDSSDSCNLTIGAPDTLEIERFVLFTSDKEELSRFTSESLNCAAWDTCCTSTVAGEKWLKMYLKNLPTHMKSEVRGPLKGKKCFQFGNQGLLKSQSKYQLPAYIAGESVHIDVDIISSDIPMLLSKSE